MIKFKFRKNFVYILVLYVSYFIRNNLIKQLILDNIFEINAPFVFLFLMAGGQLIGGFSVFYYQHNKYNNNKKVKYFSLNVIQEKIHKSEEDGIIKKMILIFFASFYDILEFILSVFYVPKIASISPTVKTRLGGFSTITASLISIYAFKDKMGRHHKLSLISLSICFVLTLVLEFVMKSEDQPMGGFILAHFIVCIFLITISFNGCIEKYLAFYNFLNPFFILMCEGAIEIVIGIFYSINNDPFGGIINEYKENTTGEFVLIIFLLFIYLFLSGLLNVYRVYCNVIYSPMARSLTEFFLNPLINIHYFLKENDFHQNYYYFSVCEVISVIMDISLYVFNEYIVLTCCGLEHDTQDEIYRRALSIELISRENNENEDEDSKTSKSRFTQLLKDINKHF